uniref:MRH domain-containing protein n=1 Tax=Octactis speculum TaxID=3111310 RepID=A0A7S2DT72_9STRA
MDPNSDTETSAALGGNATQDPVDTLMNALVGQCDTLRTGWWSYEWCHRKYVRQFHIDDAQGTLDPVWSLGQYNHSTRVNATIERSDSMVDYFVGGQHCHETGEGRQSKVDLRCCTEAEHKVKSKKDRKSSAIASFASIREPGLCSYEVTICTPMLCGAVQGGGKNHTALDFLEALQGTCFSRHEGWWSYEFCYKRHFRQFHLVTVIDAKGKTSSVIQDEYSLGKAQEADINSSGADEAKYMVPKISADGSEEGVSTMEFEYTDGTTCELTQAPRGSSIQMICGAGDAILSVVEDYTCHYKVIISTTALCKHEAFVKKTPSTKSVSCRRS